MKNRILINKKGDIPVTILVLLVILLCITAILSFSYSLSISQNYFSGVGLIETIKSISEENSFYSTTKFTSDHTNFFNSGSVIVTTKGGTIDGTYSENSLVFGLGKEGVVASVEYKKG